MSLPPSWKVGKLTRGISCHKTSNYQHAGTLGKLQKPTSTVHFQHIWESGASDSEYLHEPDWLENGGNISSAGWHGLCQGGSQRSQLCMKPISEKRVASIWKESLYLVWLFPWSSCWGILGGSFPYFLSQGKAESLQCPRLELGRNRVGIAEGKSQS